MNQTLRKEGINYGEEAEEGKEKEERTTRIET